MNRNYIKSSDASASIVPYLSDIKRYVPYTAYIVFDIQDKAFGRGLSLGMHIVLRLPNGKAIIYGGTFNYSFVIPDYADWQDFNEFRSYLNNADPKEVRITAEG